LVDDSSQDSVWAVETTSPVSIGNVDAATLSHPLCGGVPAAGCHRHLADVVEVGLLVVVVSDDRWEYGGDGNDVGEDVVEEHCCGVVGFFVSVWGWYVGYAGLYEASSEESRGVSQWSYTNRLCQDFHWI